MTGSNHISQYQPPAIPVKTGTYEDGRPQYTFYTPPAEATGPTFNVGDYGATGDGVTDDTAAIQKALNAASAAGGGVVFLPVGIYAISSVLVIPASSVEAHGAGWGTIIRPVSGATCDVFSTGAIPTSANANNDMLGVVIENLTIDGSLMAGTVAGQGNGVHFWGARQSFARRVQFTHIPNYCVVMEGSLNGGYNDVVEYCEMDSFCGGGILTANGNEANWILHNEIIGCAQTLKAAQPMFGSQSTAGNLINHQAGISLTMGNVFGGGASSGAMNRGLYLFNEGHRVIGNRFDGTEYIALAIGGSGANAGHMIANNEFKDACTVTPGPSLELDAGDCLITGNVWISDVAAHYTYCIQETQALTGNVIANNQFKTAGTAGTFSPFAGSTTSASHNTFYNPVGHLSAQPAIPASTSAYTNTSGVDCMVYVEGGTVTAIAVGGTATGATSGAFRVAAGQTITLTYSVAPTWQWFGE